MEDQRDILKNEKPFKFKITKDKKVLIFWHGKQILVLTDSKYDKFMQINSSGNDYEVQMYLAKATGNFKHGNER